jgi:hypothetical protein
MGESVSRIDNDAGTAEGATPATAQAQRTIGTGKSGERWINQPPKGHSTRVVISQVSRTDGAQHDLVLRLFSFLESKYVTKANSAQRSTSRNGCKDG